MIYNRIGDAGFLIALFLIFETHGQPRSTTRSSPDLGHVGRAVDLVAIALLLFLGAVGKSAQIPLFPWLADAMEGPTPVSALIHAATMVTAGVYLMCRINPILHLAPDAAHVVAWIGVATALRRGDDRLRPERHQEGPRLLDGLPARLHVPRRRHRRLRRGDLPHAHPRLLQGAALPRRRLGHPRDGRRAGHEDDGRAARGACRSRRVTFLIGWLSIGGVPPFSGFWSKGDVLVNAWPFSPALWAIGALTAVLTAYYMGRAYLLVFRGEQRWVEARPEGGAGAGAGSGAGYDPHDPRWVMPFPLVVLGALLGRSVGSSTSRSIPTSTSSTGGSTPVVRRAPARSTAGASEVCGASRSSTACSRCSASGWRSPCGGHAAERPALEPTRSAPRLVHRLGVRPVHRPAVDRGRRRDVVASSRRRCIDGAVNGVAVLVRDAGGRLRKVQTGYVRNYALGLVAGRRARPRLRPCDEG